MSHFIDSGESCAQALETLAERASGRDLGTHKTWPQDQLIRFRLWIADLGIGIKDGYAILERKLRNNAEVLAITEQLLLAVADNVKICLDEINPSLLADIDGDHGSSDVSLESSDPDESEEHDDLSVSARSVSETLEQARDAVADGIGRLLRLSRAIRGSQLHKSATETADKFVPLDRTGKETVKGFQSQIQNFLDQVSTSFDEAISRRMRVTMETRWRRLSYFRSRPPATSSVPETTKTETKITPARSVATQQHRGKASTISHVTTPSGISQLTKATQSTVPARPATTSIINTVSQSFRPPPERKENVDARGNQWVQQSILNDLPPRPSLQPSQTDFWCTYCASSQPVHTSAKDEHSWQRHVLQDIAPYICPFPYCDVPNMLYRTADDWLKHLSASHQQIRWCCQICDQTQSTEDDFKNHSRTHLGESITDGELNLLALMNRQSQGLDTLDRCLLCNAGMGNREEFLAHSAEHFHRAALTCLLWTWGIISERSTSARLSRKPEERLLDFEGGSGFGEPSPIEGSSTDGRGESVTESAIALLPISRMRLLDWREDVSSIEPVPELESFRIMSEERFIHQPLPSDEFFRLLVLRPSDSWKSEAPEATLETVSMRDREKYDALSYLWGSHNDHYQILVNDRPFTVYSNLYCALKRMAHPTSSETIWVDAVCIDMINLSERSRQISLMGVIYARADRVRVWLGEIDDDVDLSQEFDSYIPLVADDGPRDEAQEFELLGHIPARSSKDESGAEGLPPFAAHLLAKLGCHRLFTRRWIFQEIAAARNVSVHRGHRAIPWHLFKRLRQLGKFIPVQAFISAIDGYSSLQVTVPTPATAARKLEYLVSVLAHTSINDPRDALYAFVGMVPAAFDAGLPRPDYSKSTQQVYAEFTEFVIQQTGSLDIICRAWGKAGGLQASWIKNARDDEWNPRESFVGLPVIGSIYNAALGSRAEVSFVNSPFDLENPDVYRPQDDTPYAKRLKIAKEPTSPGGPRHLRGSVREESHNYPTSDWKNEYDSLKTYGIVIGTIREVLYPREGTVLSPRVINGLEFAARTRQKPEQHVGWKILTAERFEDEAYRRIGWDPLPCQWHKVQNSTLSNENGFFDLALLPNIHGTQADDDSQELLNQVSKQILELTSDRVFLEVESANADNYMLYGWGPSDSCEGDSVCILFGCSVPCVLRPERARHEIALDREALWTLVGESYIHGVMQGQALESGDFERQIFKIV